MPTLEVTDDQYAAIQRLREAIASNLVGEYGHVRERDAIQFLVDNFDSELDVSLDEFTSDFGSGTSTTSGTIDDESATVSYDEDVSDSDSETDHGEAEDSAATTDASGSATDDDMLDRMMNLLDTHDDKWEESSSADYRYSVTLPDGSTEEVQTKDDVRALLFKNY